MTTEHAPPSHAGIARSHAAGSRINWRNQPTSEWTVVKRSGDVDSRGSTVNVRPSVRPSARHDYHQLHQHHRLRHQRPHHQLHTAASCPLPPDIPDVAPRGPIALLSRWAGRAGPSKSGQARAGAASSAPVIDRRSRVTSTSKSIELAAARKLLLGELLERRKTATARTDYHHLSRPAAVTARLSSVDAPTPLAVPRARRLTFFTGASCWRYHGRRRRSVVPCDAAWHAPQPAAGWRSVMHIEWGRHGWRWRSQMEPLRNVIMQS